MKSFNIYDRRSFAPGATIIRHGDPAVSVYLIQSGAAEVFRETSDGKTLIAKLGAGDIIGDMAILRGTKHQSTVIAMDNLVAVVVPPEHLKRAIDSAEPLIRTLLSGMIRRIDRMNLDA